MTPVFGARTPGGPAARKALGQSFGAGAVLTRTIWEVEKEIPAIPVPTFLACLSERLERG